MKLHIEKFLALTAMIATAQVGASACVAADDTDDSSESSTEDDDAGTDNGSADDDVTPEDDDADTTADAGGEGGDEGDDDVVAEADAGGPVDEVGDDAGAVDGDDAGVPVGGDAGTEGGAWGDAGAGLGDAGTEGGSWGDAGFAEGDAAVEGGGACVGDGSFDPAVEPTECSALFDVCYEDLNYAGTAATQCWEMAYYRRAAVYEAFLGCVTDAAIADPCGEEGDSVVAVCAADADLNACADPDPSCGAMAEACPEIDAVACETTLAPYSAAERYGVTSCFDYTYGPNAEMFGPGYEGCGYDYQSCLAQLGPGGE
jgi:hypothetical protein